MNLQAAYNARQAKFIEARLKTKQEIEAFFASIENIPANVLEGINLPVERTAEALIPSMFMDPPNPEGYRAELESFNLLVTQVTSRVNVINERAVECLKEYM